MSQFEFSRFYCCADRSLGQRISTEFKFWIKPVIQIDFYNIKIINNGFLVTYVPNKGYIGHLKTIQFDTDRIHWPNFAAAVGAN